MDKLLDDARRLSAGTVATLIGRDDYTTIDRMSSAFISWLETEGTASFFTWQCAWSAFAKAGRVCEVLGISVPTIEDIHAGWDLYEVRLADSARFGREKTDHFRIPLGLNEAEFMRLHSLCREAKNAVLLLHRLRGDDRPEIEAACEAAKRRRAQMGPRPNAAIRAA